MQEILKLPLLKQTLQAQKKIKIEKNTSLLSVNMLEEPGKMIICEPGDKVLLFTQGVGPCIAIMFFCRLKSGQTIIALAHSYWEEMPEIFMNGHVDESIAKNIKGHINEVIARKRFKPNKFTDLLEKIKLYSNGETIDVHLATGAGYGARTLLRGQLYNEYIKTLENVHLKGAIMNPYGLNAEIDTQLNLGQLGLYSITAGITADGMPIICKKYDINFNVENFPNQPALIQYLKEKDIEYSRPPSLFECFENPPKETIGIQAHLKSSFTNEEGFIFRPIPTKEKAFVQEIKQEPRTSPLKLPELVEEFEPLTPIDSNVEHQLNLANMSAFPQAPISPGSVTMDNMISPKPELLPGQIRFFDIARTGKKLLELTTENILTF